MGSNDAATSPEASSFPEVALEYPNALRTLHVDYQRVGLDVVAAFTSNGHRERIRVIGKEDLLEPLNRAALQIAPKAADDNPTDLMAGNIFNSNIWDPAYSQRQDEVRDMFREMVADGRHNPDHTQRL